MVACPFMADENVAAALPRMTNSFRVSLSEAEDCVSPRSFYEDLLAPFGDIARLEVLPQAPATAVVSFFDIRSAALALATLGDRCVQEPQYGQRTVCLPGDLQLSADMLKKIVSVHRGEGGTYIIDFCDTRDALKATNEVGVHVARVAAMAAEKYLHLLQLKGAVQKMHETEATIPIASEAQSFPLKAQLHYPGLPPADVAAPKYRNDLRLSEVNWTGLANGREWRTTLRLRCLPAKLCDRITFQRTLEMAGLKEMVDCFRVFASEDRKNTGSAIVNAVSSDGVIAVAKFFHGRQWGNSMPCAVSFAAVQGGSEVRKAFPKARSLALAQANRAQPALNTNATQVEKTEPWRVETTCCMASTKRNVDRMGAAPVRLPVFAAA